MIYIYQIRGRALFHSFIFEEMELQRRREKGRRQKEINNKIQTLMC